jgi:hypothetical protein
MKRATWLPLFVFFAVACGGDKDDGSDTAGATASADADTDADTDADSDADSDADADADTDADTDADSDADTDADTDSDTDTDPSCTATIDGVLPADGEVDVGLDGRVDVTFSSVITTYDPWSVSIDGVAGSSLLSPDGDSASFFAAAPLAADTVYNVSASVCSDTGSTEFTTEAPTDGLEGRDLEGNTYALLFEDIAFSEPASIDALLGLAETPDWVLVQSHDVDTLAEELSAFATTGYEDGAVINPDCGSVIEAGPADFSLNPLFSIGPEDFAIAFGADELLLEDFTMYGRFIEEGAAIDTINISGNFDVRPLDFGSCALLALLAGGSCVPCADGATECMKARASADRADLTERVDIQADCGL